ncbi:hypothetical protein WN48_04729 [Eufriesea mexicana]|nr:hypothetical protein WN48_04729 [Eufriesea mexicana]
MSDSTRIGGKYKQDVQVIDVMTADKWLLDVAAQGRLLIAPEKDYRTRPGRHPYCVGIWILSFGPVPGSGVDFHPVYRYFYEFSCVVIGRSEEGARKPDDGIERRRKREYTVVRGGNRGLLGELNSFEQPTSTSSRISAVHTAIFARNASGGIFLRRILLFREDDCPGRFGSPSNSSVVSAGLEWMRNQPNHPEVSPLFTANPIADVSLSIQPSVPPLALSLSSCPLLPSKEVIRLSAALGCIYKDGDMEGRVHLSLELRMGQIETLIGVSLRYEWGGQWSSDCTIG